MTFSDIDSIEVFRLHFRFHDFLKNPNIFLGMSENDLIPEY